MPKPAPRRSIVPRFPVKVYLKEWRKHFGLTQQQLADRLPPQPGRRIILKGTVARWERETRALDLGTLAACAEALNIPVIWLYRPPSDRPSLDALVADASPSVQSKAVEIIETLVKP